jgi:uncharacterized membrane protein
VSAGHAAGDLRLEEAVGRVLRIGVTTSSVCLGVGLALSMVSPAAGLSHFLLNAGLIILMATPVGRVVISVAEYMLERDWLFVLLTTIVLLELAGGVYEAVR